MARQRDRLVSALLRFSQHPTTSSAPSARPQGTRDEGSAYNNERGSARRRSPVGLQVPLCLRSVPHLSITLSRTPWSSALCLSPSSSPPSVSTLLSLGTMSHRVSTSVISIIYSPLIVLFRPREALLEQRHPERLVVRWLLHRHCL
jgi:hypothetical protein